MSKCNWCGKPTQSYESEFRGTSYAPFCSNRCEVEYNQAIEEGNISPPKSSSFSVLKAILFICIALFILSKCN